MEFLCSAKQLTSIVRDARLWKSIAAEEKFA